MATPPTRTHAEQTVLQAFAKRLTELMARRGLSQSDLARAIWGNRIDNRGRDVAVNRDRISHYVRGSQMPEAKTLKLLAQALGVEPADLHPPLDRAVGPKNPPSMAMTAVGGRPDVALLTVNRLVPLGVAVEVLRMLANAAEVENGAVADAIRAGTETPPALPPRSVGAAAYLAVDGVGP